MTPPVPTARGYAPRDLALGGVVALALALRVGWVVHCGLTQHGLTYPDEELHWQLATNLVKHGTLTTDDGRLAARMPVYPLFLAAFVSLGPAALTAVRLAQAVVGAATVGLGYRIARRAFGRAAGRAAALLIAVDPFSVFFSSLLLSEVLFTFLLLALVASTQALWARPRSLPPLLALAVIGPLAVMTRPSAALLVPLLWLLPLPAVIRAGVWPRAVLFTFAAAAACFAPWGLRNRATLGDFAWLSTNGGVTLYDAQGPQADGSSNQEFLRQLPDLPAGEVARDRALRRLALDQMRSDPGRVAQLALVKLRRTWSPWPNVAEYRTGAAATAGAAYLLVVLVGGIAGTAWALLGARGVPRRTRTRRVLGLTWVVVLYFAALHCLYVGSVRYRLPVQPLLAIAATSVFHWIRPYGRD